MRADKGSNIEVYPMIMCYIVLECKKYYGTSFLAHVSQYFSMRVTPSPTSNNASCVAMPPQVMQNLVFPLLSMNDLNVENTFSILLFSSPEN